MKEEEIIVLGLKKRKEGKPNFQIQKEIRDISLFGKGIKTDKKTIDLQNKEISKLKEEVNKLNRELFNLQLSGGQEKSIPSNEDKKVTISNLNKLICMIKSSDKPLSKKQLKEAVSLTDGKLKCSLLFLVKNKILNESVKAGVSYYGV